MNKLIAEFIGTFFLVFIGISSAAFAAAVPGVGIGLLGVSLAFGLTVTVLAYAIGPVSGCHLNPAVTVGLTVAGRFSKSNVVQYVIAQVLGGVAGAGAVYLVARGGGGLDAFVAGGFASNGFGANSPGGFSLQSVLIAEVLAALLFVFVILGITCDNAPKGFAPLAIGLALALAHFATIHVSNASINPARSTATALFGGGWAIEQLWAFWLAPIVGGALGGLVYNKVCSNGDCGCSA